MKGTKEQKGITLVALIITIVVLLILAAVAISSITNDGILHYAQNASDAYNQAQKNEAGILDGYVDYLNQLNQQTCSVHQWTGGGWDDELGVDEDGEPYGGYHPTKCTVCGLICEHRAGWDEVYEPENDMNCLICYYCEICGMNFDNDYTYDSHDYSGGKCNNCGNVCQHENLDEECQSTDTECKVYYSCQECDYFKISSIGEHEWSGDECTKCGYRCKHTSTYNDGPYDVGDDYAHEYDVTCSVCGTCCIDLIGEDHEYNESYVCTMCGYSCGHCDINSDGTCMACGYICKHNYFSYGICDDCGYECNHPSYTDGECTTCGNECEHVWKNWRQECEPAGGAHLHYSDSLCENCGIEYLSIGSWNYECRDDDRDGLCDICGFSAGHYDENGDESCDSCGYCVGDHLDEDGDNTCDRCGDGW